MFEKTDFGSNDRTDGFNLSSVAIVIKQLFNLKNQFMRKVTRKSLDELAKVMPVISEENQKMYVGGTSGATGTTGYTSTAGTTGSTGYNYGGTGSYTGTIYGDSEYSNSFGTVGNSTSDNSSGNITPDNPYPNSGDYPTGVIDSGTIYTADNPCPSGVYAIHVASGTWSGGYVQGIGYRPKQTEVNEGGGQPKNWVKSLLNALYEGAGKGTINLTDIIPVGNTPSTSYCTTSASYQTITINGITLTNVYIEATSSAAHPQVSTGYSWVKPVYDNNARLVKNSYYFDVGGSDLDVVITVPVDQIKNFESLYKKSH